MGKGASPSVRRRTHCHGLALVNVIAITGCYARRATGTDQGRNGKTRPVHRSRCDPRRTSRGELPATGNGIELEAISPRRRPPRGMGDSFG
jgi:hypothetical protein